MAGEEAVDERSPLLPANNGSYVVSSTDIHTQGQSAYVDYPQRWYILAVVCILNLSNAMIWLSFSPIADITATFYGIDANSVNWLSLAFPVATLPFGLLASWLLDTIGLRLGILSAAWMNLIGAILRVISTLSFVSSPWRFPLVMIGQVLPACAQPFLLFTPTKVAAVWFKENQRTTANMFSSMSNPLGILLANILSPVIVKNANQMLLLMSLFTVPAALGTLMATFGICSSTPPTPPTSSAAELSEPFVEGLKKISKDKPYWLLAWVFGVGMAVFTALSTLLEQILCVQGYSDSFAGITGALLIGFGVIGAAFAGFYVDKTKKFEEVAKVSYSMAAIAFVFFTLVSRYREQEVLIAISVALFGFFGFATYPVCLELAVECTYPVAEATSSGFLIMSGQLQGIIFIILAQVVARPLSPADKQYQTCGDSSQQSGIEPQDYTYANLGLCGMTAISIMIFTAFFRCKYRRLQTERQLAAERILNLNNPVNSNVRAVTSAIHA